MRLLGQECNLRNWKKKKKGAEVRTTKTGKQMVYIWMVNTYRRKAVSKQGQRKAKANSLDGGWRDPRIRLV